MVMIDLRPAADRMASVVTNSTDDDLSRPTPCPEASVGDLVDHVLTLSLVFAAKAKKDLESYPGPPPAPSASSLGPGWDDDVLKARDGLAAAWADPGAWTGMTNAGGVDMPGEVAGFVVLDELLVHGWDLARATGQAYAVPWPETEAAIAFVDGFEAPRDGQLFGPVVPVPDDAAPLDRLLGLTGRDPGWTSTPRP